MTMVKTISKKISVKASAAKPFGKPLPGDKTSELDPDIRFYAIEYGYETEEVEQAETFFFTTQALRRLSKTL